MPTNKKIIDDLWIDTADVKPENFDFGKGYAEEWDVAVDQTDDELSDETWFPMMNYRYPLPGFKDKDLDADEIKKGLERAGSMTLIHDLEEDEYYLALTGGGMDLSWDIVKGYTNLGFAPPTHFCRELPTYHGMKFTRDNQLAILACRKSLTAQKLWDERGLERMDELEAYLKSNK